jgi:uncharacterized membrane protein
VVQVAVVSAVGVAVILAAAVPPPNGEALNMAAQIKTFIRHMWLDADDTSRVVPPVLLGRLATRVSSSEQRHCGQIHICIEASLPLSYLWRVGPERSLQQVTRERALMMFGKLGVWDTAHNNGVLIYVLLAEHAIEIIADRGLTAHINSAHWTELVAHMSDAFRVNSYEDGLTRAVEEVSVELERCFPLPAVDSAVDGLPAKGRHSNELPDTPALF